MGTYSNGTTQNLSATVTWASSAATVATVNGSGLVTSVAQGTATITATSGSVTASTTVTVGAPVLKSIAVTPASSSVPLGLTQQFLAMGTYTDGTKQTLTTVTWATSLASIATINENGLLTTKTIGNVSVSATSGGISGAADFIVAPAAIVSIAVTPQDGSVPAGLTKKLTATATFTDSSTAEQPTADWSSSDESLAMVSSSGLVTTKHPGDVVIMATLMNISGSAPFHIDAPVLTEITVSPASVTALLGTSSLPQFTATGIYSDQSTDDVSSSVTWNVSAPQIVEIDATGQATPKWHGYAEISATSRSVTSKGARFVSLAYPRYLFSISDSGQAVNRATVEPSTGRIRWEGQTGTNAFVQSGSCATMDPSETFLYVTTGKDASHGLIDLEIINRTNGLLTPYKIPSGLEVSTPVRCLQFEPNGNFAYAPSTFDSQLVTFQRDAAGSLTQINSISLPTALSTVAMDPLGKYLYVVAQYLGNDTQSFAYGYSIDAVTGSLTPIPGTPFQLSTNAGTFAFSPSGKFIYMSNSGSRSIDVYAVDRQTGKITPTSTVQTCVNPSQLVFSPSGDNAYATCSMDINHTSDSASVESFRVNPDGSLVYLSSAPWNYGIGRLAMDPSGQYLYVNSYGNHLANYLIDQEGKAILDRKAGGQVESSDILIVSGADPVTYTPKYAFVSSTGDNRITSYAINPDGTFGSSKSIVSQQSPFSLSMSPWDNQLLADSIDPASPISTYTVSSNGDIANGFISGDSHPSTRLAIDGSGRWAFDVDSTHSGVYTYIGSNGNWGVVTYPVEGQPSYRMFPTGDTPGPIAVDSAGRHVFVGNQVSKSITVFHHWGTSPQLFESNGQWTTPYSDGSPYALGAKPVALAVDPSGSLLYVACDDQALRVFGVDYTANGHLQGLTSKTLTAAPVGIAVDVNSRFVYVADAGGIHAFSVDLATGSLTEVALGTSASMTNVNGVYAEPSGQFLYVTTSDTGTGSVLGFQIQADGTLSPIGSGPLATPNQPSSMTFSTDIK